MAKTTKSRQQSANLPIQAVESETGRLLMTSELITALRALLPPYDQNDSRNDFAKTIRSMFECDAMSYFLVSRAQSGSTGAGRMELQVFSYDGYKSTPKSYPLGSSSTFLTTYVFEVLRSSFNQSAQYLEDHSQLHIEAHLAEYKGKPPQVIPCSNRCAEYIATGRFTNILAVPIRTVEGRYAGILKFENREGCTREEPFPEADVRRAEDLARLVGLFVGPRDHGSLWVAWARQEPKNLQSFVEVLARNAPAECASVFVRKEGVLQNGIRKDVLRNSGGVGYKRESYRDHEYEIPSPGKPPAHLTTWVAENGPVRKTITELLDAKSRGILPFSNACEEYIGSTLRDLLAIPVERDGQTVAVVKLENKLPPDTHFDAMDERLYSAFSDYVVTALLPSKKPSGSLAGEQYLEERVGPRPLRDLRKRDRPKYDALVLAAYHVHLEKPALVTITAIRHYLGDIAKNTWSSHLKDAQAKPAAANSVSSPTPRRNKKK